TPVAPAATPAARWSGGYGGGSGTAYDSLRKVTVLANGGNGTTNYQETWEWDGTKWVDRKTSSLGYYPGGGSTFDSARGVFQQHVGSADSNGRIAEWDGTVWSLAAPTGAARQGAP